MAIFSLFTMYILSLKSCFSRLHEKMPCPYLWHVESEVATVYVNSTNILMIVYSPTQSLF